MNAVFEVKSTRFDALSFRLFAAELDRVAQVLQEGAGKYKAFGSLPFVVDAGAFSRPDEVDWQGLLPLLAEHGLNVIGLSHRNRRWAQTARRLGLAFFPPERGKPVQGRGLKQPETAAGAEALPAVPEPEPVADTVRKTVVVSSPVRTGQQVYAEKADLIVVGMVSEGAEVIADGNIHVYGPLRGRALAGESGDRDTRIFAQSMQAELVSVAGIYRVFEQNLPPSLHRQAVLVELNADGKLAVRAIAAQ